ncbi:MAG: AraC family transcriptional regulator [Clostridiales bacterium]|nr:AraC family transcriptional regulator [Clostridiales bacterium]
MENQSYYINLNDGNCNQKIDNRSIAVNCAGACVINNPFTTDNPRGREDYYLQYLVSGEMYTMINGRTYLMPPGSAIFYYPHTYYKYWATTSGVCYYWAHFSGKEVESIFSECGLLNAHIYPVGIHNRLITGFERLFQDFISRDRFFELSLGQIITKLCLDIARLSADSGRTGKSDTRIDKVIEKIHQSYDRELSVTELASSVFLSEGHLRVLFRERCGMSPQRYLTLLRINAAKQLLEQPNLTISEVARSVGIPDPLYFSRIFRAETGLSPSKYRENTP